VPITAIDFNWTALPSMVIDDGADGPSGLSVTFYK